MEQLECRVLETVYRNHENGYSVVEIRVGNDTTTAVGMLPQLLPGETLTLMGEWTEHRQYGRQFKCTGCATHKLEDADEIEGFLASGLISGVGETMAHNIVERFGRDTLRVFMEEPERLQEVKGIGRKSWRRIAESYREQMGMRNAFTFLQHYGIAPSLAIRISRVYGDMTEGIIRENPYRLCDEMDGVGFQTADAIAVSVGIAPDSPSRIRSGIKYVLSESAAGMGHCYLPETQLVTRAAELMRLDEGLCRRELAPLQLKHELALESAGGETRVFLQHFDLSEREVATRLYELSAAVGSLPQVDVSASIDRFEKRHGMQFSPRQREAISQAMAHGVLVITGGPGTGKTTIINCIISLMPQRVLLCAPTGRAAKRMSEATGRESKTIHRLLEYSGEEHCFMRDEEEPLEADAVIVDEMSMVDLMLMRALLRAIKPGTRLILVGDSDQLPSVGAGNVLGDILESGVLPCVRLTDIFRQAQTSHIVVNAHRINRGELPILNSKGTDFFFDRRESAIEAAQTVVQLVSQRLPKYLGYTGADMIDRAVRSIQVLSPTRKGECGVTVLNNMLQAALNPPQRSKPCIEHHSTVFRLGDKVMQTHNDYELPWQKQTLTGWEEGKGVFNGDVGFVTHVDTEHMTLTVRYDEERDAEYKAADLENLELAYALSVHKSQGSEFPVVIIPVVGGPQMLLTRNLFYTALTRARQLVVLVGREDVIVKMVNNDYILRRYTALQDRLVTLERLYGGGGQ